MRRSSEADHRPGDLAAVHGREGIVDPVEGIRARDQGVEVEPPLHVQVDDLLLVAAVWVDWAAEDEEQVYAWNAEATRGALAASTEGRPAIEELLALRAEPENPFFRRA